MRGRVFLSVWAMFAASAVAAQPPQSIPNAESPTAAAAAGGDDYEVLTRGPVHEAFAELAADRPQPGPIVPSQPPPDIEEQPPETRPAGENVVWLPGYWHFDDELQDYLWVSGLWRAVPPGREWTPGYWREVTRGYQWVAGYWAEAGAAAGEVAYLPPPPASLEAGPTSPAPADNYVWAPGCWIWRTAGYVWRPGFWILLRPNWVWIPHYYVWTPYGCVLAGGYSDYPFPERGLLCAPIYFRRPIYAQPAFYFRPRYCIGFDVLSAYLFVRPRYCHYYFGDYFAPRYAQLGCYPWFRVPWGRGSYDPLFAHYRSLYRRTDRDWDRRLVTQYAALRDNAEARPPRTLAQQLERVRRGGPDQGPSGGARAVQVAQSLDGFRQTARTRYGLDLRSASGEQLQRAVERRGQWRGLQASRRAAEVQPPATRTPPTGVRRARWNAENPLTRDLANVRPPRDSSDAASRESTRIVQPRSRGPRAAGPSAKTPSTVDRAAGRAGRGAVARPDVTPPASSLDAARSGGAPSQARSSTGGSRAVQGLSPPERSFSRPGRGATAGSQPADQTPELGRGEPNRGERNRSEPRVRAFRPDTGSQTAPGRESLRRPSSEGSGRAAAPSLPPAVEGAPRGLGRGTSGELRRGPGGLSPGGSIAPRSVERPSVRRPFSGSGSSPGGALQQPSRAQIRVPRVESGGAELRAGGSRGALRSQPAPSSSAPGAVNPGAAAIRGGSSAAPQTPQRDGDQGKRPRRSRGG